MSAPNKFYDIGDRQLEPDEGPVYGINWGVRETRPHATRLCEVCRRIVWFIKGQPSPCTWCAQHPNQKGD